MKIAYIVARYPHLYHTFIWREIREVQRQGIDLVVYPVTSHSPTAAERDRLADEPFAALVRCFSLAGVTSLASAMRLLIRRPLICLRLLGAIIRETWRRPVLFFKTLAVFPKSCAIAEQVRAGGYQLIHAHWSSHPATCALIASRLSGVPFSFAFHAYDIYDKRIMLTTKLQAASFVVANCRYTLDFMEKTMPDVDRSKVRLLYNGVEIERYQDAASQADTPPLLLAVGRLVQTKGFDDLIEAARSLHDDGKVFHVAIAGAGPLHDHLQNCIHEGRLQDVVELVGPRSEDEIRDLLGRASMTIVPACPPARGNSHDGLPNIVIESLAAGVPVIATGLFGIPEIIRHGVNGMLVPPHDPGALAATIGNMLDDHVLMRRIGREGRRTADKLFDTRKNASVLVGYFREAVCG